MLRKHRQKNNLTKLATRNIWNRLRAKNILMCTHRMAPTLKSPLYHQYKEGCFQAKLGLYWYLTNMVHSNILYMLLLPYRCSHAMLYLTAWYKAESLPLRLHHSAYSQPINFFFYPYYSTGLNGVRTALLKT